MNLSNRETAAAGEQGGYSGPQLFERTLALVKVYRKALDEGMQRQPDPVSASTDEGSSNQVADQIGATVQHDHSHAEAPKRKVIFASGGITNARQVQEVLAAGSSIALLYTALVYGGVGTVSSIKSGLQEEMNRASEDGGVERKN